MTSYYVIGYPGFSLTVAKATTIHKMGAAFGRPPKGGAAAFGRRPPFGGSILCIVVAFATVRENPGYHII